MRKKYLDHYQPLVQEFCAELQAGKYPDLKLLPQPFLPLFGEEYEKSSLRIAIVGQDTRGYGKDGRGMLDFIERETKSPGSCMMEMFDLMDSLKFTQWGPTRHQFFGFTMRLLAAVYGIENWNLMKRKAYSEILRSFAWGNCNSVELWNSTPKHSGVSGSTWNAARNAAERFDHVTHLIEVLKPQVIVVAWKDMNPDIYLKGTNPIEIAPAGDLRHYKLPDFGIDVFHIPHPNNMRFSRNSTAVFDELCRRFREAGLVHDFPNFLCGKEEEVLMIESLKNSPNRSVQEDKYGFIEWVANELAKQESFMSVPLLAELANSCGYLTNYGTPFRGGRGTYRLIRSTYNRLVDSGKLDKANLVARAFRRPNFEYAFA